jgi:ABC-type branched-subunit amino acid transport system ATPase component
VLLSVEAVARAFGGVRAVDGATFGVGEGEVHGLIGPNGAGKTTLLNLVSGLMQPTGGAIRLGGERIDGKAPHQVAARGITRTFQNIRLFGGLSAAENVIVGEHLARPPMLWQRLLLLQRARAEEDEARTRALALLERVGLRDRAFHKAAALSYGEQRRVEIARALASSPRLLLLDEPTAGMNPVEVSSVEALIRNLVKAGQSVLLVEHNVRLVMEVSDRVTVLNFGKVIADGPPDTVSKDPAVIAAYLGTDA